MVNIQFFKDKYLLELKILIPQLIVLPVITKLKNHRQR